MAQFAVIARVVHSRSETDIAGRVQMAGGLMSEKVELAQHRRTAPKSLVPEGS
jgi:hypothetical protein